MFNSKYNTLLTVLLIIAIIAIVILIGYFGYSVYNKYYINRSAEEVVSSFEDMVGNNPKPSEDNQDGNVLDENSVIGGVGEGNTIYSSATNNKLTYKGYNVVGIISIPSINVEYPILEKVTTNSIKVGVAYLSGAKINKPGNTIIQGHNYRNGLFFSNLYKLSIGDAIFVTDQEGTRIKYEVYKNFSAESTDTSFYNRDTEGKRELTLSTCTEDEALRTIILAREVEG